MTKNAALSAPATRDELRVNAGLWLRELREQAGLSQKDLAAEVGLSYYTFISQIESGKGRIPPERYEAFANALQLETRSFAIRMLSYYEPMTHALIFDQAG